jgi:hypothetical protein
LIVWPTTGWTVISLSRYSGRYAAATSKRKQLVRQPPRQWPGRLTRCCNTSQAPAAG